MDPAFLLVGESTEECFKTTPGISTLIAGSGYLCFTSGNEDQVTTKLKPRSIPSSATVGVTRSSLRLHYFKSFF